ncbi:MAG: toxin-antitoxin system HicB family antitoxin [Candidatus Latescibacteria bacterium]|nr:toxin-antitoxin system HicB family antitoxin [Candidatus Latescibacterota bacterium]
MATKQNNNVLTIRVPKDLKDRLEKMAHRQGVSMNQFAIYAFTREISELEAAAFFQAQYKGKKPREIMADFDAVMDTVPKRKRQPAWDQLDS